MEKIGAHDALANVRCRDHKAWNRSPSSSLLSDSPTDASRRIYEGFASINYDYPGKKFEEDASVFAMGSCFAREIEAALLRKGANIVSLDDSIKSDVFKDGAGKVRSGFLHRFTPFSIWQEFFQGSSLF